MVQGGKKQSNKKVKKNATKNKHAPVEIKIDEKERNDVSFMIKKKIDKHQKNIYKSIEGRILEKAKAAKERFDIL